jgi:serine/threonine protein kinase
MVPSEESEGASAAHAPAATPLSPSAVRIVLRRRTASWACAEDGPHTLPADALPSPQSPTPTPPLPPPQVLLDLAHSLAYLHALGLLHGDVKPDNVLLKSDVARPLGFATKVVGGCVGPGRGRALACRPLSLRTRAREGGVSPSCLAQPQPRSRGERWPATSFHLGLPLAHPHCLQLSDFGLSRIVRGGLKPTINVSGAGEGRANPGWRLGGHVPTVCGPVQERARFWIVIECLRSVVRIWFLCVLARTFAGSCMPPCAPDSAHEPWHDARRPSLAAPGPQQSTPRARLRLALTRHGPPPSPPGTVTHLAPEMFHMGESPHSPQAPPTAGPGRCPTSCLRRCGGRLRWRPPAHPAHAQRRCRGQHAAGAPPLPPPRQAP